MFDYVDIHSHLYFPDFDNDRDEEILRICEKNIATISIGTNRETSRLSIDLAQKYNNIFACVGQHPADLTGDSVFDREIVDCASNPRTVAIGECGLDYFRMSSDEVNLKSIQKNIFDSHIMLSVETGKPLMLHIRGSRGSDGKTSMDAYEDALDMLEKSVRTHGDKVRGNAHFFAGSLDVLKRFLNIGFTVSFTGVITFTHEYDELVTYAPITSIMSETDAPFVAPVPYRGKRNSPLYVPEVVSALARIRNEDSEMIKKTLSSTATQFFGLDRAGSL